MSIFHATYKFATKFFCAVIATTTISTTAIAQADSINIVSTAVPFLRISPDARAGGMGDVAIATSADANASFWNISKVNFAKTVSYTHLTLPTKRIV